MRKLSLLSRMRTCGRRRPLSGPISCNATVRILLRALPSATPAPNGGMRPSGTHAPWMQRRGWLLRQPPRWLRVALAY